MVNTATGRNQVLSVITSPGGHGVDLAGEEGGAASTGARDFDQSHVQRGAPSPPPSHEPPGDARRPTSVAHGNGDISSRPEWKHRNALVAGALQTQGGDNMTSPFAPSIQPEFFKVEAFDCEQFISSRRHLPLEKTKAELRVYLRQLKNELVELINRDYADFTSLSTSLVGTDKAIHELSQPLSSVRNDIQIIRSKFQETIDELEKMLAQRSELRERKAALQLLLNIARSVEKIEALLEARHADDKNLEGNEPGGRDKVNERVAIELNQLRFLVGRGQEMAYVETVHPRILRIESALRSSLAASLRSSLAACETVTQDDSMIESLTQCLRTYAAIEQTREAEDIIAREFVRPFIEKVVCSYSQLPSIAGLYEKLLEFTRNKCAPLTYATEKALRGASYEVLTNAVWTEIVDAISAHLPTIFASGNPDVFHTNYKATMEFVAEFEKLYSTRKSWAYLRAHRSYATLMKKWQISVYFQLRFKEICVPFDEACQQPVDFPSASHIAAVCKGEGGGTTLALDVSNHLIRALSRCWADGVYLRPLAHRFWKLSLQLLSRYSSWIRNVLNDIPDNLSTERLKKEKDLKVTSSTATIPGSGSRPTQLGSASASLQEFSSRLHPMSNDNASSGVTLVRLAAMSYEATHVCEIYLAFYGDVVKPLLTPLMNLEMLHDSLITTLQSIRAPLPEIHQRIVAILVVKCCESLRQVRGITGQYRHMNRKPPTEPSHFVSYIFKPLSVFKEMCGPFFDRSAQASLWTVMVCEPVTGKYTAQVAELLAALKATEDSLKRLKKGISRQTMLSGTTSEGEAVENAGTAASLSDEDKIRAQLWLDAIQYGKELASIGVNPETFDPYKELRVVVEQYSTILQATSRT